MSKYDGFEWQVTDLRVDVNGVVIVEEHLFLVHLGVVCIEDDLVVLLGVFEDGPQLK